RFHHYNRSYLLGISLCSTVIPFLTIPLAIFGSGRQNAALIHILYVINSKGWEEPVTLYARHNQWSQWINLQNGLYFVYLAGAITGLIILIRSLIYIKGLKRKYPFETIDRLKIYFTAEPGTPFSFFRSIFWDKKISVSDGAGQQIFRHEMFHVKQRHSADILLLETLGCICWFNPFFHLIKKELKAIHEFLADAYAASGNNRYNYAELLLLHAIRQKTPVISHPFFHNQIKRRITMITKSSLVRRNGYLSRIMALPVVFLLVSAFAVKLINKPPAGAAFLYADKKITVVIDPGHGGPFPGANSGSGVLEKDINLEIAKTIAALSGQYNVQVVLTRNSDATVGRASSLREDLLNRVAITNKTRPDLLVSIHLNAATENIAASSGFDAYISGKNEHPGDKTFASTILNSLKDVYTVNDVIRQVPEGIVVLDKSNCPALCLECGYITNPADLAFISKPANREKIARHILAGIVKYGNDQTTAVILPMQIPIPFACKNSAKSGRRI
ncbi:MAG: M56/M15 family metallopeptidase, partial [Bacteroidota bacterium]